MANIGMIAMGYSQSVKLIRDIMETCDDYDCALKKLSSEPIPSICYFILAGTKDNEGAVITRDRSGPANVTTLTNENWYVLQTNQDHYDGHCGLRCQSARANLDKLGQGFADVRSVFINVLMQGPVLN